MLAKKGRGKTYTAAVLAEELIGAGVPVCVLDPTGVWWECRAPSRGDGLPTRSMSRPTFPVATVAL